MTSTLKDISNRHYIDRDAVYTLILSAGYACNWKFYIGESPWKSLLKYWKVCFKTSSSWSLLLKESCRFVDWIQFALRKWCFSSYCNCSIQVTNALLGDLRYIDWTHCAPISYLLNGGRNIDLLLKTTLLIC